MIAFSGVRADGAESIFLMRPDGTHLRDLGASGECADWSPDARKIAFCHQTHGVNGWDVWVMNADGSDQHPLVASGGNDYPGPWSPDAKELSFGSIRTGIVQTYVIRADGSRLRQLTHGADPAAPFIWLDDGRIIVAVSKPGSNPDSSPPSDWYALDVGEGHMVALPQLHGAVELDWQAS